MTKQLAGCVLCIGSDPVGLNLRCNLLKHHGLETVSCASGHEGIFRFSQRGFRLVVLDLDGDGSESALIASELKRHNAKVPIIMLVADKSRLAEGAVAQADAVLLKAEEDLLLPSQIKQLLADS